MNLIEAIKSGKRFKRQGQTSWCSVSNNDRLFGAGIDRNDLLADDYEIEQTPVPITSQQFWDAYHKAKEKADHPGSTKGVCEFMARELGL